MNCPACAVDFEPSDIAGLTVCQNPACVRTLVIEGESCRVADASDTLPLSETERAALKRLRPAAWRADVKARHARILGGMAR